MEYFYYLILVAAIALVSFLIVKIAKGFFAVWDDEKDARERQLKRRDHRQTRAARGGPYEHLVQPHVREHTPAPWGWPGNKSSTKSRFNELSRNRRTVDDPEWLARKEQSLRALVEDRYGRSVSSPKAKPNELTQKPKDELVRESHH